jgi:heme exporter protein D
MNGYAAFALIAMSISVMLLALNNLHRLRNERRNPP